MRITPVILILILVISAFLPACKERKKDVINTPSNPDSIATMVTRNVKTLISDSGMTKYRITSMIWYVYDEAKKPCWKFPKGLLLEKFDNFFKVEATIRCDSALYLKNERVWRLDCPQSHLVTDGLYLSARELSDGRFNCRSAPAEDTSNT